jgi:diguanylate cyclase (GGDEF)-like protein/PAS domain S-box-containing protein
MSVQNTNIWDQGSDYMMNNTAYDVEPAAKLSMEDSEIRYRRLFEAAQDGILILDAKTGMIEDVNPYLIKMLGYSREEFIKSKLWDVGAFKDIKASMEAFQVLQKEEYIRYKDLPLKAKDGGLIQVEFVSNVYLVDEEKVIQCNIRDITDRKQAQDALIKSEALLRELSIRDQLTGLFNRRYMEETLEREIHRAERKHLSLGIIMLDVDDFKQFNDTHGHAAGDAVLKELGKMLIRYVRKEDIPSRYGGDEFIIILPEVDTEEAYNLSDRIRRYVASRLIKTEAGQIKITISLGIASLSSETPNLKKLINCADSAMYEAKSKGRNCVCVYSEVKG